MTTRVSIQSPANNHQAVRVEVVNGTTVTTAHKLNDGESVDLYVYDGQKLHITETEKDVVEAPPAPVSVEPVVVDSPVAGSNDGAADAVVVVVDVPVVEAPAVEPANPEVNDQPETGAI